MKRLKKPSGRKRLGSSAGITAKRLLIVIVILLPVVLGLAIWLAFFTDACAIEEVVITGNVRLSAKRVRELSGVDMYKNLVTLPVGRIAGNLENEPWIKDARIGRRLPDTVLIDVVERKPLAVVDCFGVGFVVDDTGYVITGASAEEFATLPLINASEAAPPEVGQVVKDGNTIDSVKVLVSMSDAVRSTIQKADTTSEGGLVFVSREGFEILFGAPSQMEKKGDVLEAVLEDVRSNEREIEYLDVRVPDSPVIMPR